MNTFMGIKVVECPWIKPVPAIQVRNITLADGTPLLRPDFLAQENAWWKEQYGTNDVAYMFSGTLGQAIAMHPKHIAMLKYRNGKYDVAPSL